MNFYESQKARVETNIRASYAQAELTKALEPDLAKGKKANIGEIREWRGKKYQKTVNGWVKVPNVRKWKEEFVDEDTGEIVEIERTEDLDKPEPPKKTSASQERRARNADKISAKYFKEWQNAVGIVSDLNK